MSVAIEVQEALRDDLSAALEKATDLFDRLEDGADWDGAEGMLDRQSAGEVRAMTWEALRRLPKKPKLWSVRQVVFGHVEAESEAEARKKIGDLVPEAAGWTADDADPPSIYDTTIERKEQSDE